MNVFNILSTLVPLIASILGIIGFFIDKPILFIVGALVYIIETYIELITGRLQSIISTTITIGISIIIAFITHYNVGYAICFALCIECLLMTVIGYIYVLVLPKYNLERKLIEIAYENIDIYKNSMRKLLKSFASFDENTREDIENKSMLALRDYTDANMNDAIELVQSISPRAGFLLESIIRGNVNTDYDMEINIFEPVFLGRIYHVCYYALTKKDADPSICVKLNHIQAKLTEDVLFDLDDEYKKQ